MPFWSFGHRLFITSWVEDVDGRSKMGRLKYGWYRNSTRNLYRSWKQSWPKFRRHISLSIRAMSGKLSKDSRFEGLSDQDIRELESNDEQKDFLKNKFLDSDYWKVSSEELYWCTIDLKGFYPSINTNTVLENAVKYNEDIFKGDDTYVLISRLLDFRISDKCGWDSKELDEIECNENNSIGLPTGLIVSGFLSNIALLGVDLKVQKELESKEFACFRFVDDHVILSNNFDVIESWYHKYLDILKVELPKVEVNQNKTEPEELKNWLNDVKGGSKEKAKKQCKLDSENPTPLVTQTLLRLSLIATQDISFLTEEETQNMINDLNHFLLADFADHEIKKETQVSFALTILSKLIPELRKDYSEVYQLRKKKIARKKSIEELCGKKGGLLLKRDIHSNNKSDDVDRQESVTNTDIQSIEDEIHQGKEELKLLNSRIEVAIKEANRAYNSKVEKYFNLFVQIVTDNFSKPKLWLRLIEYCSNTGHKRIGEVFERIDSLKKAEEINHLNYEALNILCVNVICINALKIIRNYNRESKFIDSRNEDFLRNTFSCVLIKGMLERLSGRKYDAISTRVVFLATLRFVSDTIELNCDNGQIREMLTTTDLDVFDFNHELKNHILYWSSRKLNPFGKIVDYWKSLSGVYDKNKPLAKIVSLMNDDFRNNEHGENDYRIVNRSKEIPTKSDGCINKSTLQGYLFDCEKGSRGNLFFSEYSALCIVKQLILLIKKEFHSLKCDMKIDEMVIHPGCFNIEYPIEEIKSWSDLDSFFETKTLLLSYDQNNFLHDKRYMPDKIKEYQDKEISEIYAIGIIMWQMVYKRPVLPIEFFIDNGRSFLNSIESDDQLKYFPSSYTESIIQSCLSPINRESVLWILKKVTLQNYSFIKEIESDKKGYPPLILNLPELGRRVQQTLELLKSEQISIKDNIGRQLIYTSFQNPSSAFDILKYEKKNK